MHHSGLCLRATRFALVQLAIAGLATLTLPAAPTRASDSNNTSTLKQGSGSYSDYRADDLDYQLCATRLLAAGIVEVDAASACALALYPRDLSRCVSQIDEGTIITATDALDGCRRVRRSLDLATCVIDINTDVIDINTDVTDINTDTQNTVALDVLDNCRRSLLPTRFANCVVGLSRETSLVPAIAMDVCIAAGDRPRNVLPSFVPRTDEQLLPLPPLEPLDDRTLAPLIPSVE